MGKVSSDIQSLVIKKSDFPASFTWGVATSSFQIEGAGQQDGRAPPFGTPFARPLPTLPTRATVWWPVTTTTAWTKTWT